MGGIKEPDARRHRQGSDHKELGGEDKGEIMRRWGDGRSGLSVSSGVREFLELRGVPKTGEHLRKWCLRLTLDKAF